VIGFVHPQRFGGQVALRVEVDQQDAPASLG
jgi:hypothetical protein